jgi:hypothetical protein
MKTALIFGATLALLSNASVGQTGAPTPAVEMMFNLPIGGKLDRPLRRCPANSTANDDYCWLEKAVPRTPKNDIYDVRQPFMKVPAWVHYRSFRLHFDKAGNLATISLRVRDRQDLPAAIASVSQRFGAPAILQVSDPTAQWVTWRTPAAEIKLMCAGDRCLMDVLSTAEVASREEHSRQMPKRPMTP